MKKILLITALLALVSMDASAETRPTHRGWWNWFPRWEQKMRETCPRPVPVNVPDGGSTAILLGLSCAGLAWAKRKTRS